MVSFTGIIKTTDGKKWSVGFQALSLEDAESLAEIMGISELGISYGTIDKISPSQIDEFTRTGRAWHLNLTPPVSHFCSWHYRGERLVNEDDQVI